VRIGGHCNAERFGGRMGSKQETRANDDDGNCYGPPTATVMTGVGE
jgi:hypothetical protein